MSKLTRQLKSLFIIPLLLLSTSILAAPIQSGDFHFIPVTITNNLPGPIVLYITNCPPSYKVCQRPVYAPNSIHTNNVGNTYTEISIREQSGYHWPKGSLSTTCDIDYTQMAEKYPDLTVTINVNPDPSGNNDGVCVVTYNH